VPTNHVEYAGLLGIDRTSLGGLRGIGAAIEEMYGYEGECLILERLEGDGGMVY
jgi:hypothetical protein